jgi:hypothetical protein
VDKKQQAFKCWRNSRMAVGQREGSLNGVVDETLVRFSDGSWLEHGIGNPQRERSAKRTAAPGVRREHWESNAGRLAHCHDAYTVKEVPNRYAGPLVHSPGPSGLTRK